MPKVSPLQAAFHGGEFSPLMYGRVDSDRYKTGLATCLNLIALTQGPLTRRPGTRYVAEVKTSAKKTRVVRFEFSTTQAYIIEFGDLYCRFYRNNGQILDGGSPYEIATPYAEADLFTLKFVQSADVLYIAHPSYAPRKLSRTGHTAWTLTAIDFLDGPYLTTNAASYKTLKPSATTGTGITITSGTSIAVSGAANNGSGLIRLTTGAHSFVTGDSVYVAGVTGTTEANGTWTVTVIDSTHIDLQGSAFANAYIAGGTVVPAIFASTDIGRLVRMKHSSTWGYAKITAYTNPGSVTADVKSAFGAATAVSTWRLGLYSTTTGWPACTVFHEDRLFFGGPTAQPQRLDGSKTGDYENFAPTGTDGTVAADNAVGFALNASDVNAIRWLASEEKGLLAGTVGAEWLIRPSSTTEALSATNISAKATSRYGSANLQPVQAGKSTLFVQVRGRKVRELRYFFEEDGHVAPDMTVLAEHVTGDGIVELAYQQEPQSLLWAVRSDGVLLSMTYERDFDSLKVGWARHVLGGTAAAVKSVAVIPSADGTYDELWMVVSRTIGGATKQYVEYLTELFDESTAQEDAVFVDSSLVYDGAPATTISGLAHLNGETVAVLADGAVQTSKTVAAGQITLDKAASVVQVGLGFNSDGQTLRWEAGAADGTALGKTRRMHRMAMLLYRTLGLKIGMDFDNLFEVTFRKGGDPMDEAPPLYTGVISETVEADYDTENQFCFRFGQPTPGTLQALMPQMVTQDRG